LKLAQDFFIDNLINKRKVVSKSNLKSYSMKKSMLFFLVITTLISDAFSKKRPHCFSEIVQVSFEGCIYKFQIDACCIKGDTSMTVNVSPLLTEAQFVELETNPNSDQVFVVVASAVDQVILKIADYALKHLKKKTKKRYMSPPPMRDDSFLQAQTLRMQSIFYGIIFNIKFMNIFLEKIKNSPWIMWASIGFLFLIPYAIVSHLPIHREVVGFILGEQHIPFLPWTFVIYGSLVIQYLVIAHRMPNRAFKKALVLFGCVVVISLILFVVFPIEFPRNLYTSDSWFINLIRIMDSAGNCFPSLHVSATLFLTSCYVAIEKTRWRQVLMWLWTLLITISVLTTKQHYLIDIFGAIVLIIPFVFIFKKSLKI